MANIYELTKDWNAVYSMIDDEEIDETAIPNNSLLREFIGGSVFDC